MSNLYKNEFDEDIVKYTFPINERSMDPFEELPSRIRFRVNGKVLERIIIGATDNYIVKIFKEVIDKKNVSDIETLWDFTVFKYVIVSIAGIVFIRNS